MKYRKLGRTDLMIGEIGMGSEGLVNKSSKEIEMLVHCALRNGINYFDLYNSDPKLHTALGQALAQDRSSVFIEGHLCTAWKDEQYLRTRDISLTIDAFEAMMRNLSTDYIDVGMIHCVDGMKDFNLVFHGEILEYAKKLKANGTIRYIGLSSHNPTTAKLAVEYGDIDVLLFSVNPAYDMVPPSEDLNLLWAEESYHRPLHNLDPERESLYELCEKRGVGITVMKAFGGGDLLNEKLSPFGVAMSPIQCIHYALTRPAVASVLGGYHTAEEILASIAYFDADDTQRDFSHILSTLPKHSFSGRCMYCGHCAPCPQKIDVAAVNKYLNLALSQGSVPETVSMHYSTLDRHASDCLGCGTCERNCPFSVPNIHRMALAAETFGY